MPSNQAPSISRDAWSEHIAKWKASKLTRAEYCRQHDLKLNTFIYQNNSRQEARAKTLKLVPVKVCAASDSGEVVLRGPNGWSLAMTSGVSTAWLGELLGRLS